MRGRRQESPGVRCGFAPDAGCQQPLVHDCSLVWESGAKLQVTEIMLIDTWYIINAHAKPALTIVPSHILPTPT